MKRVLQYGSWPSALSAQRLLAGALRLGRPQLDRGWLYWLEGRPVEGGRQAVVRARPGVPPADVTPRDHNVRTLVHEYGGGDYRVHAGRIAYAVMNSGTNGSSLFLCDVDDVVGSRRALADAPARYADFDFSPDGRLLVAVEERPRGGREPENRIVVFSLEPGAPREAIAVAEGHDFVSFPRFSPDGSQLVYTAWAHPNMPWDGTRLFVQPFGGGGPAGAAHCVAGGTRESIFQPGFSPDGLLTFVSDRSGWWNLERIERDGRRRALCPREAEFGRPQWVFGMSTWAYASPGEILCSVSSGGFERLSLLDVERGTLRDLGLPYTNAIGLEVELQVDGAGPAERAERPVACFVGGTPDQASAICRLDLASGTTEVVRAASEAVLAADAISRPEAMAFDTEGGVRAYAFFYPPVSPDAKGPHGERPPLIVKSHGGPTSAALPVLNLAVQYWTSRGFAVVDVNYGGSSGYGRPYRERLRGGWGVVDVQDCVNAARHLVKADRVDPERLAISGGSAGGYTTLCALTFTDMFRAGASHYGIGDLEALVRDTHKFESRYLEGLVGPYPERADLYRARSPIHHSERLACPVIFFQGLEDKVVPPNQAVAMVEALARRGVRHAYVAFPGEQHGFRRAENIRMALEGELYFYAQVFGFETDVKPAGVEIVG
jgi:dipeptidyl aminopeptidase/acylaminoacyl peptidase